MDPDHYEDNGVHLKAISPDKVLSPCRRHPRCPQADDQPVQSSNRRARWQAVTRSRWILWTTGHLLGHRLVDRRTREVSQDDDTARCCILNCVTWCNSRVTGYEYTICSSLKWDKSHTNVLKVFYTGIFFLRILQYFAISNYVILFSKLQFTTRFIAADQLIQIIYQFLVQL